MDCIADALQALPQEELDAVQALMAWKQEGNKEAYKAYLKADYETRQKARDMVDQMI